YDLSDIVEPREYADEDVITKDHPEPIQVLVVRYEGIAEAGDEILAAEGSYARLYPVSGGDIVISNIAASHGSIAVVPDELDKSVVSSEYTVLKVKDGFDPRVVQLIVRSPEIRADLHYPRIKAVFNFQHRVFRGYHALIQLIRHD